MNTHFNKVILTGMLSTLITCFSCEKILETDLPENQMQSETVFENLQTANSVLSGLYAGLFDASPIAGDQSGYYMGIYTDDLNFYALSNTSGLLEIANNTLIDSNSTTASFWSSAYQKIYICNTILEGIEDSKGISEADKKRIKGEALTIRSLLFFYLQQVYGDIPYPVTTNYMINQSISKTQVEEVSHRLESDLQEAVDLLPDAYRNTERIYINKKSAQLLLAKVYMQHLKPQLAEVLLKNIVQSPLYHFQTDITKVFNKTGTHIIWQLKPKNNTDAVKEATAYYFANAAPLFVALSPSLVSSFSTGDLRKQYWMAPVSVGANTWYRVEKYKVRSNNTTEYSVVLRLEEVYLLLAEALARQNKIAEALPYINPLRQRAAQPLLNASVSQQILLADILAENRKEFFTEMGNRFLTLKRFGSLDILLQTKPNWKDYHRLWPVPQKDILLNANLNPQNSGY